MSEQNIISGQIVLREAVKESQAHAGSGRKLMIVIGIIAVPEQLNLKGECKYTVASLPQTGNSLENLFRMVDPNFKIHNQSLTEDFEEITIKLFPETEEDISDETIGQSISGIIKVHNRWRV